MKLLRARIDEIIYRSCSEGHCSRHTPRHARTKEKREERKGRSLLISLSLSRKSKSVIKVPLPLCLRVMERGKCALSPPFFCRVLVVFFFCFFLCFARILRQSTQKFFLRFLRLCVCFISQNSPCVHFLVRHFNTRKTKNHVRNHPVQQRVHRNIFVQQIYER